MFLVTEKQRVSVAKCQQNKLGLIMLYKVTVRSAVESFFRDTECSL